MALPVRDFYGKLNNKTIYDFVKQLDFNLSQEDRIKKVKEILYTGENGKYLDEYFIQFFEQKEDPKQSYYNPIINQDDFLSEDKNVFQTLEQIANYILYSPDGERINKKTQYNFYTRQKYEDRFYRKEESLEGLADKMGFSEDEYSGNNCFSDIGEVIDFIKDGEENFKKEKTQKIFSSDFEDPAFNTLVKYYKNDKLRVACIENIIKQYSNAIEFCKHTLSKLLVNRRKNSKKIHILKNCLSELKKDQIFCKDNIKRPIYFKSPMKDDGKIDYQLFNFTDHNHVSELLRCNSRDMTSDLGILIYDLEKLIEKCNFNDDEKKLIELYRDDKNSYEEIAFEFGVDKSAISKRIDSIVNRIINVYLHTYEDWLYLNYLKGNYKKCSCCGKIKLDKYFGKHPQTSDGLYPICKACRNSFNKNVQ